MDRDKLVELKDAVEQKSTALNERRTELQKELEDITAELVRLQGDYRTIEQILADFEEPKATVSIPVTESKDEDGPTTAE